MRDSIRAKCQAIWLKAYQGPVVLSYTDKGVMQRARFALYDALRKTDDQRLLKAKEDIEVRADSRNITLTIQRRELNPFYGEFEKSLEVVAGEVEMAIPDPEESLKRFQEKMCKEEKEVGSPRKGNKYFNRKE